jgi:hypothetical protein
MQSSPFDTVTRSISTSDEESGSKPSVLGDLGGACTETSCTQIRCELHRCVFQKGESRSVTPEISMSVDHIVSTRCPGVTRSVPLPFPSHQPAPWPSSQFAPAPPTPVIATFEALLMPTNAP